MQNRSIVLLLVLFFAMSATSCTRSSTEELVVDDNAPEPAQAEGKGRAGSGVMPMEEMPDVKISPTAEIPSDKDATDFKVPDVKIDATEGLGNIDETRVDGADEIVDEP